MSGRSTFPIIPFSELSSPSRAISTASPIEPPPLSLPQSENLYGPVAILWDIENCPIPSEVRPEDIAGNIRLALRVHPLIKGAVTLFSAYGDFNSFPRRMREGCQRTGVKLVDVPNGRKDAADKAILVDMFLFALDNRPPSSIMLISGDVDFAPALHILGQRGYTVVLVIPSKTGVSSALSNAGRFVWDWPSIACGKGFTPLKRPAICGPTAPEILIEDEAIVYRGSRRNMTDFSIPGAFISPLKIQRSVPGSSPPSEQGCRGLDCWVQPGDIQGLKGQLVELLNFHGGSLPFVRVSAEYLRSYGRPLYMSEYGVANLVNLIKHMPDTLFLEGKGAKKHLRLLRTEKQVQKLEITPKILKRDNKLLESFMKEMQEILVCYSCPVPLNEFEALYEQRYKKSIDYWKFRVEGLEELVEKTKDVIALCEDRGGNQFLVSTLNTGYFHDKQL